MRKQSLEGKITILKSLEISKVVHLAMKTKVPNTAIEELKQIQKKFLWDNKKVKIKQNTLRNDYKDGGLKSDKLKNARGNYPFGKLARVITRYNFTQKKNSSKIIFYKILPTMLLSMMFLNFLNSFYLFLFLWIQVLPTRTSNTTYKYFQHALPTQHTSTSNTYFQHFQHNIQVLPTLPTQHTSTSNTYFLF